MGSPPIETRPVIGRGYSLIDRRSVRLADGRRVFMKLAVNGETAGFLRDEQAIYSRISGGFLPALLGWDDDGEKPLLVIEDLSDAHWPPPWRAGDVELVMAALESVWACPPPDMLARIESERADLLRWPLVAADPAPLLSVGVCDREWLAKHLPVLIAAAEAAPLDGDRLLHLDVRSDNICIRDGRAILIDWNWAMIGNPDLDLAAWLPSLESEGGPAPEQLLPDAPELASLMAGYFASYAGLPPPDFAPRVREVQKSQLRTALPWAARALGLPPPG
jgi:phosphotransferase family enzyme